MLDIAEYVLYGADEDPANFLAQDDDFAEVVDPWRLLTFIQQKTIKIQKGKIIFWIIIPIPKNDFFIENPHPPPPPNT